MEFDPSESAEWAQASDQVMDKLTDGVSQALAENAGRGFSAPTGDTLASILAAGKEAKSKLAEANGKIYEGRRGVIFQEQEFDLNVLVKLMKLAMELYREEIMNALAIEQSEVEAARDRGQADVIRLNAEVDLRQAAIIQAKAEMDLQINALRAALVAAETATLGPEEQLINAQLATAEKKLEIIDSIYQVLAAEELVLVAERHRADSLQKVLLAQQIVVEIKKEMIPSYIEKAEAREELADAVIKEIPIREAIEKLGYDRIALKDSEEAANHLTRAAENEYELAREIWTRANKATELAKAQSRRLLQEYSNIVRERIIHEKEALEKGGVDLRLNSAFARHAMAVNSDVTLTGHEIADLTLELNNILMNMVTRTNAHVAEIGTQANVTELVNALNSTVRHQTII